MALDLTELRDLLAAINQTDIAELTLKSDDFELTVRRGTRIEGRLYTGDAGTVAGESMTGPPLATTAETASVPAVPLATAPAQPPPAAPKNDRKLLEVISPMVGTFYSAPAPDEPPFVGLGDRIQLGQTVCIIEAMKLMNELEAEVAGEVVEILVKNGEPVEYGQPLMRVSPP